MTIRPANRKDAWAVTSLALRLWPVHETEELYGEMTKCMGDNDACILVAAEDRGIVAFAQCALRYDYVEGTDTCPVGYLEGVYVLPECRRGGVAAALVAACEAWARERGCAEFASDCLLDNRESIAFHLGCGFREASRLVCFAKKL